MTPDERFSLPPEDNELPYALKKAVERGGLERWLVDVLMGNLVAQFTQLAPAGCAFNGAQGAPAVGASLRRWHFQVVAPRSIPPSREELFHPSCLAAW